MRAGSGNRVHPAPPSRPKQGTREAGPPAAPVLAPLEGGTGVLRSKLEHITLLTDSQASPPAHPVHNDWRHYHFQRRGVLHLVCASKPLGRGGGLQASLVWLSFGAEAKHYCPLSETCSASKSTRERAHENVEDSTARANFSEWDRLN